MNYPADLRKDLDELQTLIAERTIKHGVERVITPEIFRERIDHYLAIAKKEVEAIGPETNPDRTDFTPMATIFSSTGWEANLCVGWPDGHKKRMMWALAETCRITLAQGVIFRNVMTGANMLKIAEAMHLNCPDPHDRQKVNYFEERMWKWIESNYGKVRLAALPPELRWDGVMVAGFGPKLEETGRSARYWWEQGKIHFEDFDSDYNVRIELIPRWWQ